MGLLMIATIQQNDTIIGFRVLDTNAKDGSAEAIKDVPINSLKKAMSSGLVKIDNLEVHNGEIIGSNGDISRYTILNRDGTLLETRHAIVVINQLQNVGYTIVGYKGQTSKIRTEELLAEAKRYGGIANGKIVTKDNITYVSSISGSYELVELRINNDKRTAVTFISTKKDNTIVAKGAEEDAKYTISESDVFKALNPKQREALKDYYIWYTVEAYKGLAKNIKLNVSATKAEALAKIRGETEWRFAGVWDMGFKGGGKCTMGHPLRYVYYAAPESDLKGRDSYIAFGKDCSAEFFEISKEDMDKLIATANKMSEEVGWVCDRITNKEEDKEKTKLSLMYDILNKLTDVDTKRLLGENIAAAVINFRALNIPFTESLVTEISKKITKNTVEFYSTVFPECSIGIRSLYSVKYKAAFMYRMEEYLNFIADNKIQGKFAYDPHDENRSRKDVGKYNKQTRSERSTKMYYMRSGIGGLNFTFKELEENLQTVAKAVMFNIKFEKAVPEVADSNDAFTYMQNKVLDYISNVNKVNDTRKAVLYNTMSLSHRNLSRYGTGQMGVDSQSGRVLASSSAELKRAFCSSSLEYFDNLLDGFVKYLRNTDKVDKADKADEVAVTTANRGVKETIETKPIQKEVDKEDKMEYLKSLLSKGGYNESDYGIQVAKDILKRKIPFNKLSDKQKWRIEATIKALSKN